MTVSPAQRKIIQALKHGATLTRETNITDELKIYCEDIPVHPNTFKRFIDEYWIEEYDAQAINNHSAKFFYKLSPAGRLRFL